MSYNAYLGFKGRVGLVCATSWSLLMLFLFKAVPVPGVKISLPLYESIGSCESLLQVEWQPVLSPWQNTFSLDYGMQVDIMRCCFCLLDFILYVPSTIFQLNRDGCSWDEPVLR